MSAWEAKYLPESRQRTPRGQEKTTGHGLEARRPHLSDRLAQRAFRQSGGLVGGTADQAFGCTEGAPFRRVKRLAWRLARKLDVLAKDHGRVVRPDPATAMTAAQPEWDAETESGVARLEIQAESSCRAASLAPEVWPSRSRTA